MLYENDQMNTNGSGIIRMRKPLKHGEELRINEEKEELFSRANIFFHGRFVG